MTSVERPVPLHYRYVLTPLHETITELLSTHEAPVYVVHFTQASAVERAQALMSVNVTGREEKQAIADLIGNFRFTAGFGKTLSRLVRHGIGVHHAGMLPRYRRLVETLAQAGLLKVICGTDTLGVGINVPIRTVLFTALTKYDGVRTRGLKAREFHQIAGRAGRAGYDVVGTVVAQAPEHEVENARLLARAGDDVKKRRRIVRKKAPEGFVNWSDKTFERLQNAQPEALTSHFVGHARDGAQRDLPAGRRVRRDAAPAGGQPRAPLAPARRTSGGAISIYRGLREAGVVEELPEPDPEGRRVRIVGDLQLDFALNQPLSPFALAALELLDRESPDYPMDVLSVVEATLDDPRPVLYAQQSKAKGEAVAAMKAEGIEYEQRMVLLEDVTWPKPLDELLTGALETYRRGHPWVADARLSPKSVVRDMSERAMTFVEYVGHYQLARSEGLVLRYLADTYRALRQTVPDEAKTEELTDVVEWLGELVRQVDSSLLDEWEKLAAGRGRRRGRPAAARQGARGRHPQHPRLPRAGAQCAVPARGAGRAAPVGPAGRAGPPGRLGRGALARGAGAVLRRARPRHRHRDGPDARGPRVLLRRRGAAALARPAGPRRPRGRPRLGDQRGGRPGGVGRGGRRGRLGDGRGAPRRAVGPAQRTVPAPTEGAGTVNDVRLSGRAGVRWRAGHRSDAHDVVARRGNLLRRESHPEVDPERHSAHEGPEGDLRQETDDRLEHLKSPLSPSWSDKRRMTDGVGTSLYTEHRRISGAEKDVHRTQSGPTSSERPSIRRTLSGPHPDIRIGAGHRCPPGGHE